VIPDFYSFIREEDAEGLAYFFTTNENLTYSVYFNISEYSNLLEAYPVLLQEGYAFGFFCKNGTEYKHDPLIFPTILKILSDFYTEKGPNSVLLYHCDSHDSRHPSRNRLFQLWYRTAKNHQPIYKYSLKIEVNNNQVTQEYYMGFICLDDNKYLTILQEEFDRFSANLALGSVDKG
jgi:hypothetical protein